MDAPALRRPTLVAAWPGMGGVADVAATYLARSLGARPIAEIEAPSVLDLGSIAVKGGLVQPAPVPRATFHAWRNPDADRDLLIVLANRQPQQQTVPFAERLLDEAARHGVERVFTFAAMASPIHPAAPPRVLGICTRTELVTDLQRAGLGTLGEGEIAGLHGVVLAAAAARHLPGIGLLGEFPFFAAGVPNPKASAAILRAFARLEGLRLELDPLDAQAREVETGLVDYLDRLQRAAGRRARRARSDEGEPHAEPGQEAETEETSSDESAPETGGGPAAETPPPPPRELPEAVKERIEELFEQTRKDRSHALELKAELDRAGVFKAFEDRFLDLFRQAG